MAKRPSILHEYESVIHGVQAMRRYAERLTCPLQGGTGIAAQFYPHQIQNVQRILSACRIRHLIADEVGMGKTIQALMIANALRLQRGTLRVRILVPRQELKRQWSSEILCRAHTVAEIDKEPVGDDWFDIVQVTSIESAPAKLNPTTFDLLILDEPQSLKADLLDYVTRNAYDYTHLLLLTATPELRSTKRLCGLLQILEPARMERARREVTTSTAMADEGWATTPLDELPTDTFLEIHDRFMATAGARMNGSDPEHAHWTVGLSEDDCNVFAASTWWTYRNILRSRRVDYPDHLPARQTQTVLVEPSTAERERMQSVRDYLRDFLLKYPEPKFLEPAATLMRRAVLGGESLQTRLRELRRGEAENEPRLLVASDHTKMEAPDARLDALVDWLTEFWRNDPLRKVVIAAQDNPTVDELTRELSWRFRHVGSRGNRLPLKLVSARDEKDDPESTTADVHEFSQLHEFERGDAQLLIAHDAFREAYNLQAAEALVLYSLPWKPEWLDQWIGRVDRLGREVVNPERARTSPIPIRIVTIHRRGDPSVQVENVFHRYRLFEEAMDPEANLSERMYSDVLQSGLGLNQPSGVTNSTDDETVALSRDSGNETLPPTGSPWTLAHATSLFSQILFADPIEPVLRQITTLGHVSTNQEDALARWLKLLRNQRFINIHTIRGTIQPDGLRSNTYYSLGQDRATAVPIASLEGFRPPWVPFFLSRRHIHRPPIEAVVLDSNNPANPVRRRLEFLSHGAPLHEELLETFRTNGLRSETLSLRLFVLGARHYPNGTDLKPGIYYSAVGYVDSTHAYANIDSGLRFLEAVSNDGGQRIFEMRGREAMKFRAECEADQRFIRVLVPAYVSCVARQLSEDGKSLLRCDARAASDLLTPRWTSNDRPHAENYHDPNGAQLPAAFRKAIAKEAKAAWLSQLAEAFKRFDERCRLIRVESEERLWNLRAERADTLERIKMLEAAPSEYNDRIIQLTAKPRLALLEEQLQLVERGRDLRIEFFEATKLHLAEPVGDSVFLQTCLAIDLRNDPQVLESCPDDEDSVMATS